MSAPESRAPHFLANLYSHAWWILVLIALATLWLATERRIERVEALTDFPTWSASAPARDPASPTGFEGGQRSLIVPGHHNPSYWWIMEAQMAAEEGALRLRRIDYDSAPEGRAISRTSLYRWWLIGVGWIYGAFSGEPLGYAIERGALFADPLLLALLLVVGAAYVARYIGSFAAVGFAIGGMCLFPLASNFQPGAPDPHSLSWVLAAGSVLPLLASARAASRGPHFVLAGIMGGLGLWNDAPSQAPVLLAILLGGSVYELARGCGAAQTLAPSSWRAWAGAGALTALAASLFEFAPGHFSWSLDAAHPIHALAWWGIGEALRAAEIWSRQGRPGFGRGSLALLGVALLALAAWPVVGFASESGGLLASDFNARELANHPGGGFASSFSAWLERPGSAGAKWATLLPCALLIVALSRIVLEKVEPEARGRLAFALVATLFAVVLAFYQLRWWNLVDALALALMAALFAEADASGERARWRALGSALLVAPGLFAGFPAVFAEKDLQELQSLEAQALIERDFSYWLAKRSGEAPSVLFATPIFSGAAAYYGGFDAVTGSDSENVTGFLTATRIASATTGQEASILINTRAITHLALPMWDPALSQLVRIGLKLPAGQPLPEDALAVSLEAWHMPLWMWPMNYSIPNKLGLERFDVRVFAVREQQSAELAMSRLADFLLERGQLREAASLREVLKDYTRSAVALAAVANVDLALGEQDRLNKSLEALVPMLSRRAGRDLPADRRFSLAALFIQTERDELAREQLATGFMELDAATLRIMTPGGVVRLLALGRALKLPFPSDELEALALELVSPEARERLATP